MSAQASDTAEECQVLYDVGAACAAYADRGACFQQCWESTRLEIYNLPWATRDSVIAEARRYADFRWTPEDKNLTRVSLGRCDTAVTTSPAFTANVQQKGYPYKNAGYDGIEVWNALIGAEYGAPDDYDKDFLAGAWEGSEPLGRSCGVLGVDCAGFIGKVFRVHERGYTSPSNLQNPQLGNCDQVPLDQVGVGDLVYRYDSRPEMDGYTHYMLVKDPPQVNQFITVFEAGSVIRAGETGYADRVHEATYTWEQLTSNHFGGCKIKKYVELTNPSASLGCTATFSFDYSGPPTTLYVDLGLEKDLVKGTYNSFGVGSGSPITVTDVTKWASYTEGTQMYFRVRNADGTIVSPIMSAGTVRSSNSPPASARSSAGVARAVSACVLPSPTFSSMTASLGCTPTFGFSYSGSSPTYSVDLGLASDMVIGTYLGFGAGGGSPITVPDASKWSSYAYGTDMWFRVKNADGTVVSPPVYAGKVTCNAKPTFSNLSASLGCTPTFGFSYSGSSSRYYVDLGLEADMVNGTYLRFGDGTGSPITVSDPEKWSSYANGTPMWFRVKNADGSIVSAPVYAGQVSCGKSGFTGTPSATLGCSASFNFSYSGLTPSFSVDLSLTSDFSSGVYIPFGQGTGSPIVVNNPGTKWWNSYTQGRRLYYRIFNGDKSKSVTGSAVVSCSTETLGSFTSRSATLGCTPRFDFAYSGYSPTYRVDLSLTSDFSSGVYLDFASGSSSPLSVSNPKSKWSSYTNNRTLYYRVWNASKSRVSSGGAAKVSCAGL